MLHRIEEAGICPISKPKFGPLQGFEVETSVLAVPQPGHRDQRPQQKFPDGSRRDPELSEVTPALSGRRLR